MNREAILKLISEPEELAKVSINELQRIADKYPYFNQLQILLQQKKQQVKHVDKLSDEASLAQQGIQSTIADDLPNNNDYHKDEEQENLEFDNLEEENSQLPFDDDDFKQKSNISNETVSDHKTVSKPEIELPADTSISDEELNQLLDVVGRVDESKADDLTLIPSLNNAVQQLLFDYNIYAYIQLKKIKEPQALILSKLTAKGIDELFEWQNSSQLLYQNKYHRLLMKSVGVVLVNKQDDLQKIIGIGSINERKLHALGILSYEQLAALESPEIEILTELIDYFPDRIRRDAWVEQAKAKMEEFRKIQPLKLANEPADIENVIKVEENALPDEPISDEIVKLKAKLEAHKSLRQEMGATTSQFNHSNGEDIKDQPRESFRDWLNRMNKTSDASDEKKNLLVNDSTNLSPI